MEYTFHIFNKLAADGVSAAAEKFLDGEMPVIVCVGSDLAIGDSLGPVCGSMLQYKTRGLPVFVYGTLPSPVTAKEIPYLRSFLKDTHAGKKILAVDAAVGRGTGENKRQRAAARRGREQKAGRDRRYFRDGNRGRKIGE